MSSSFPNETPISSSIGKRQRENEEQIEKQPKKQKQLIGSEKLTDDLQEQAGHLTKLLDDLEIGLSNPSLFQTPSPQIRLAIEQLRSQCKVIMTGSDNLKQSVLELRDARLGEYFLKDKNSSLPPYITSPVQMGIAWTEEQINTILKTIGQLLAAEEETASTPPFNQSSGEHNFGKSPLNDESSNYSASDVVLHIENRVQKAIEDYLDSNPTLPLFKLREDAPKEDREFVDGMKIPRTKEGSKYPSLLLHGLGNRQDSDMSNRVRELFNGNKSIKFLCNTSGSGKTRLLLEGLCQNWGYYFTALNKYDGIGSLDFQSILNITWDTRLGSLDIEGELGRNRARVQHRFRALLLIRMVAFRVFLNHAFDSPNGLDEGHKARWLLLQLAPVTLVGKDIFNDALRAIGKTQSHVVDGAIDNEEFKIRVLILEETKVFCVLDEAQLPASMHRDYFRSDTNPSERRPILREILRAWTDVCPFMIISGTRVSIGVMMDVVASAVAKPDNDYDEEDETSPELFTNIGAFDDTSTQIKYLRNYLPERLLIGEDGEELKRRIQYWLHGRHRFTATYASCLLVNSFLYPRPVLNSFFNKMSGFQIADEGVGEVTAHLIFGKFDFSKLKNDDVMRRQLAGFVFDYIFDGNPRSVGGPEADELVEYGFARFNKLKLKPKHTTVDEPLVLLAAFKHFNEETTWNWSYFLNEAMTQSDDSARGNSFERFVAYLLGKRFKSPVRLGDVFSFQGSKGLQDKSARLVSIRKHRGQRIVLPIDITSSKWPTYCLGRKCKDHDDALSWFNDPEGTVFCFPPSRMGPDLILFLQLVQEEIIIGVNVQFKQRTKLNMSPSETRAALDTTDPDLFYAPRKSNVKESEQAAEHRERIKEALNSLIGSTGHLIRALAAYPVQPDMSVVSEADKGDYPVVTIDLQCLATTRDDNETLKSLVQKLEEKMEMPEIDGNREGLPFK
ncbi:hypothetical protein FRB91_004260 [Serendipita sp. 411]|nr:hypothetical protein FRC16_009217 [Serendipita sp. 398]KAG8827074.1 hypothetical protein FRC18_009932 [Serendipita sp. 400]KAG8827327.1 hypothetical protein FRC19_004195 [Serendipita sp. 401]KAG8853868.1 hypothetical protein FRB91_004260 [Serendipita sp. 411]KAG8866942.1 hypothetical protein FRC20_007130 [Serendipita sp. 405]KAG9052527.1 hypothetical protein FS842_009724 [Serendipita sp. 407]